MKNSDIDQVIQILRQLVPQWKVPVVGRVSGSPPHPFKVLISCILSLRTQDKTTNQAARRLFRLADNPQSMLRLTSHRIEKAIYNVTAVLWTNFVTRWEYSGEKNPPVIEHPTRGCISRTQPLKTAFLTSSNFRLRLRTVFTKEISHANFMEYRTFVWNRY